jgi:hypothetical protein
MLAVRHNAVVMISCAAVSDLNVTNSEWQTGERQLDIM